jgi:hypothetical protein
VTSVSDKGDRDVFGYRPQSGIRDVFGAQVGDGKHPDTLDPVVVVALWFSEGGDRLEMAFSVDGAERLAEQLTHWAARAREKEFRPPP